MKMSTWETSMGTDFLLCGGYLLGQFVDGVHGCVTGSVNGSLRDPSDGWRSASFSHLSGHGRPGAANHDRGHPPSPILKISSYRAPPHSLISLTTVIVGLVCASPLRF